MKALPEPVELLGVRIHPVTRRDLVETLVEWAITGEGKKAYYVNAHALNLAYEQPDFRESLSGADLVYCDGYGVKWGAALKGLRIPARISPPDWIDEFLDGVRSSAPICLLGDEPGVAGRCAEIMTKRHPGLEVVGSHHGYFGSDAAVEEQLLESIRASRPAVLLVGLGMPQQEYWIDRNLEALPVALAVSVGALLSYYSGARQRPPSWMTDHGLEWLGRLVSQPARMSRRYLVGNPRFLLRVLRGRAR